MREICSGCGALGNFSFSWEAGRPRGGFSAGVATQVKPILFLAVPYSDFREENMLLFLPLVSVLCCD